MVKSTHKDKIHELVAKATKAEPGHKDWLPHYPAALTQVLEGLTEEEREEAEKTLEEWNEDGVPREVQQMWGSSINNVAMPTIA